MRVEFYTTGQFDKLEAIWHKLETGSDMTAFQTFEWYRMLNDNYRHSFANRCLFRAGYFVLMDDQSDPIAIAPMILQRIGAGKQDRGYPKGIYFFGRETPTDYFSFIYKDINQEQVLFLIKAICEKFRFRRFFLSRVRENTVLSGLLTQLFDCRLKPAACAAIRLSGTFDEYYDTLSKHTKQNYRTAMNKAKRNGINLTFSAITKLNDAVLARLNELYKERQRIVRAHEAKEMSKLGVVYNRLQNCLTKRIAVMDQYSSPWVFLVQDTDRGEIIAFFYGLYEERTHSARMLFTGMDAAYASYSPITAGLIQFLKDEYERTGSFQLQEIDFTRGGEKYKYALGGTDSNMNQISFEVSNEATIA